MKDEFWSHSKVNGTTFREKENGEPLPWNCFKPRQILMLRREPENTHDKNAIKVIWVDIHIGYIPAGTAEKLAPLMDDGKLQFYGVITEITGGTEEKTNKGINIEIWFFKEEEE